MGIEEPGTSTFQGKTAHKEHGGIPTGLEQAPPGFKGPQKPLEAAPSP